MTDFFSKQTEETKVDTNIPESVETVETIKVGDAEYTQEELTRLVGLGKLGVELEEKWNTKLDRVVPEYTKTTQELKRIREEQEQKATQQVQEKTNKGEELSPEEQERLVKQELKKYGAVTQDEINTYISQYMSARDLLDQASTVVNQAVSDGKPKTTVESLLEHMQETGIKNPEKAYKDMFENELDRLKEEKYAQMKQPGLVTTTESTAGAKQPQSVPLSRDNLSQSLSEFFRARRQG